MWLGTAINIYSSFFYLLTVLRHWLCHWASTRSAFGSPLKGHPLSSVGTALTRWVPKCFPAIESCQIRYSTAPKSKCSSSQDTHKPGPLDLPPCRDGITEVVPAKPPRISALVCKWAWNTSQTENGILTRGVTTCSLVFLLVSHRARCTCDS